MQELIPRQMEIWQFIREYREAEGFPSTRAEIAGLAVGLIRRGGV